MDTNPNDDELQAKGGANARELACAFGNALLFVPPKGRPSLQVVQVTVTETALTLVATDSHILYRERLDCEASGETVFLLERDDVAAFARAAKTAQSGQLATFQVYPSDVVLAVGGVEMRCRRPEDDYPNVERLWVTAAVATERVALSRVLVGQLVKIKGGAGPLADTLRFMLAGELRPVTFQVGERIDGLVMPVRVA